MKLNDDDQMVITISYRTLLEYHAAGNHVNEHIGKHLVSDKAVKEMAEAVNDAIKRYVVNEVK